MKERLNCILILTLILMGVSCENGQKNDSSTLKTENELKTDSVNATDSARLNNSVSTTDSINAYNELANPENRKTLTISEYNTDNPEIENIKRPEKTIIRNLEIDTTKAFGIWTQDPYGPHADFWLTAKSFYVVDYDGDGEMPYILDKNKITIFYNDFIQTGVITSTKNDTLKIKWSDMEKETEYVKFEN